MKENREQEMPYTLGCITMKVKTSLRYTFFNVRFRVIAGFYRVFCQEFRDIPESGQGIG